MKLCGTTRSPQRGTTKEILVAEYLTWENAGFPSSPTPRQLLGLFYLRYKSKYRLFPCSEVKEDLENITRFVRQFMAEDPTLAPFVIEYFFSLRQFSNIQSATFCHSNILSKWGAFEHAEKLRSKYGVGEQSEFHSDTKSYGTIYV